ncbi:MAG: hypothetical protein Q8M69_12940 [Reyranella sp.]|nr:hypothetical protein [Reyranella sp.]
MPVTNPRKLVTFSPETARRIDDYRFGQWMGSESEALWRLIDIRLNQVNQERMPEQEARPE